MLSTNVYNKSLYFNHFGIAELNINGYHLTIWNKDSDTIYYEDIRGNVRSATRRPAAWTLHLHGNAPSGTFYGSYRLILPDRQRVTVREYL